jgi:hypothetical protein
MTIGAQAGLRMKIARAKGALAARTHFPAASADCLIRKS